MPYLELEGIAKKGVARKAWLLMLVNALLPAFNPVMVRRGCSSFKRKYACSYTRGSVRSASGFVLTGKQESNPIDRLICRQSFLEYFES